VRDQQLSLTLAPMTMEELFQLFERIQLAETVTEVRCAMNS
jgi:hypothetical protein